MIRLSFPWMIDVFKSLDALDAVAADKTIAELAGELFDASGRLEGVYAQSIYWPYLRSSRESAVRLSGAVEAVLEPFDLDRKLTALEAFSIKNERDLFLTVFRADISMLPAYLVTKKENYDVDYLIDNGIGLFPNRLFTKAPETVRDVTEVGRCLAFERYTACGFHTYRILEAVARRYWDAVAGGKARPHPETIGNIAGQLKQCTFGEVKVYETLDPLAKHHRNPLAHHDVILDMDEAIQAIGVVRAAITMMMAVLPDVPQTTATTVATP